MVVYACRQAGTGGPSVSWSEAWSTRWVPGQSRLPRDPTTNKTKARVSPTSGWPWKWIPCFLLSTGLTDRRQHIGGLCGECSGGILWSNGAGEVILGSHHLISTQQRISWHQRSCMSRQNSCPLATVPPLVCVWAEGCGSEWLMWWLLLLQFMCGSQHTEGPNSSFSAQLHRQSVANSAVTCRLYPSPTHYFKPNSRLISFVERLGFI